MGKNINGDRPTAFPLEQEKLPFTIPVVEEPRPKIAKLVAMITDRVPAKLKGVKGNDPEYWGLADLISDEMADVALKMGVRKPKTIGQLMKLTKLEREPLQKLLDDMAWVGLIEYNWENLDGKNPNHEKRYVLPQFVPGSAEFFNMRRSQMDEHPQVAAFFERMTFLPLEKITPMVPPGGAGIGMHVIPVEKAIETENEAVGLEKISYWLHKYEGKYASSAASGSWSRSGQPPGVRQWGCVWAFWGMRRTLRLWRCCPCPAPPCPGSVPPLSRCASGHSAPWARAAFCFWEWRSRCIA